MKKNLWMRILVGAYRGVPAVVSALENYIEKTAVHSFDAKVESTFKKLAEKHDRKSKLINLKCLVDDAVSALSEGAETLIRGRLEGIAFETLAKKLKICPRAIFRKYEDALSSMAYHLRVKGFDDKWFYDYFENEPYLSTLFEKYSRAE